MMLFLFAVAGLSLVVFMTARRLLRLLSGLQTTLAMIVLSTAYFSAVLYLARKLLGDDQ
ncbi:hypothetical protein [uncultured Thiocystis sp.]|jgi:hypothetical protein|uniref:hypothetical protein n=1 Tax=uncultured Thiocystis sp. TaxID=1202134 RepID=UPI0025F53DFB|nr:hypothetical protein [uncultured Thiocystis sp.]